MKNFCTLILFTLFAISSAQAGTLTASTDRTRMNQNETLNLTVQYDEDPDDEEPDTQALEQQFTILGRNRSASLQIVNGQASRSTSWEYELMPLKSGTLLIPSFSINGNFSEAISIEVTSGTARSAQTGQEIYTETSIDRQTVYVQQQAVITWRLVSRLNTSDPQFMPPKIDNVLVQDLGNRAYQRSGSDGNAERVIEQRYALFPQQSGNVAIPPQQFQVTINSIRRSSRGILHPGQTQARLRTDAVQLTVQPGLPASNPATGWLPATRLDISQEITGTDSNGRVTAGTAFTRLITLRAEGLSAEQLPALTIDPPGTRSYAEPPELKNETGEHGVIGLRQQRIAVIATASGELLLPEMRIPWYDTGNDEWREAVLPAKHITVLPAPGNATGPTPQITPAATSNTAVEPAPSASTPTPTPAASTTSRWWQASTALLAMLLVGGGVAILRLRRQVQQLTTALSGSEVTTRPAASLPPAASADLATLHRELLAWGRQHPAHAAALADSSVAPLLAALVKHLYGNGPAPDGVALSRLPEQLAALSAAARQPATAARQLDTLYH